jgi:hypothetical protein
MQPLMIRDTVPLQGVRTTSDGRLLAEPRFARVGIQVYGGRELGIPDKATVRLYRSPEAVFDQAAMASFCHRTVTNDHPPGGITIDNFREEVVGFTGDTVTRDGNFVRVPMMLADAATIEDVKAGKVELSAGYTCLVDWTPGVTPDGEEYDGQMKNLRGNHVAIVNRGRAGPACRLGDGAGSDPALPTLSPTTATGGRVMPEANVRPVLMDGITIHTNDAGAEAIARLQRQLADASSVADALRADHARAVQGLEGQISALRTEATRAVDSHRGEVDGLRASHQQALDGLTAQIAALQVQTSDAAIDARVTARAALLAQARRILGDAYEAAGQTDSQIRRAVVAHALPAMQVADTASDDYVRALFDAALAAPPAPQTQPDPLRAAIAVGGTQTQDSDPRRTAYQEYVQYLENAHRAGKEG